MAIPAGSAAKTDTQTSCKIPLSTRTRKADGSLQWFLEKGTDASAPVFHKNALKYFICGEDAFADIAAAIKRARKSIDIVCWGLDPAMELSRTGERWPRGDTWGSLLLGAALGEWTGGQAVQVRVLSWYDSWGSMSAAYPWGNNNMPGYEDAHPVTSLHGGAADVSAPLQTLQSLYRGDFHARTLPGTQLVPAQVGATVSSHAELRHQSNRIWYGFARSRQQLQALSLRVRNGDATAVARSKAQADVRLSGMEEFLTGQFGTYHQKTVLIDYDDNSPSARPVGYVMGLNSVTDYWDSREHRLHDSRRGAGWEGVDPNGEASLRPLQDYATRIEGDALVMVAKNFSEAWNAAQAHGSGENLQRRCDPTAPPAQLSRSIQGGQSVQILRTEPQANPKPEQTIERLYYQTLKSARNYIYIENQYFQYAPWIKALKAERAAYVAHHRAAGTAKTRVPELHLMVVTPTPEKAGMVPRTHDAIKELGHGNSMPGQSKRLEDEIRNYKQDMERYVKAMKVYQGSGALVMYPPKEPTLSPVARTYMEAGGGKEDNAIQDDLRDTLGLRSLVASMWTCGHLSIDKATDPVRFREIYIHSKLMLADDSMFTIGSANMNARSFYGDGEINMVTDCPRTSEHLRREVWSLQTGCSYDGGSAEGVEMKDTFEKWAKLIESNGQLKRKGKPITGFLVPLLDERTSSVRMG